MCPDAKRPVTFDLDLRLSHGQYRAPVMGFQDAVRSERVKRSDIKDTGKKAEMRLKLKNNPQSETTICNLELCLSLAMQTG